MAEASATVEGVWREEMTLRGGVTEDEVRIDCGCKGFWIFNLFYLLCAILK